MVPSKAPTRPIILAVNPSHAADAETQFWSEVASEAVKHGWQLIQVAARAIPDLDGAVTERLPARLWQYAQRMRNRPSIELRTLPPWMSRETALRHVEWDHRRWELGSFDQAVFDGVHRLSWFLDGLIEWLRPAIVLTTNKIDHPCAFARAAALHHGLKTMVIERSPFDGIWLEPNGLFAESKIWETLEDRDFSHYASEGNKTVGSVVSNPAGFRVEEASPDRPDLGRQGGPVVFLPLDNLLWTGWAQIDDPQGSRDNPLFATPQDGIEAVAHWAARRNGRVALKAHPSCVETRRLTLPHNVELVDGDLIHLLVGSDLTVVFNTKIAFLAAALGTRLAVLADNPIATARSVPYWRRHSSVDEVLDRALEGPPPDAREIAGLFGWLEAEQFYAIEGGHRGPGQLVTDVINSVPSPSGNVLGEHEIVELEDRSRGLPQAVDIPPAQNRRLIIDMTRLADPRGRNSGIGRYCDELLDRIARGSQAEVWALIREPALGWPVSALSLHADLRDRVDGRVLVVRTGEKEDIIQRLLGPLGPEDVFHSTHLGLPDRAYLGEASRVITIHDVLHLKHPELYDGPNPPTIQRIVESLDMDSDWTITVSDQTRRDLLSLIPKTAARIRVVPLGVGFDPVEEEDLRYRPGYILAMLQAEPRKNLPNTVAGIGQALATLSDPTVEVVFVVSRQTLQAAADAAEKAGLSDRVRYAISPSDSALSGLYSNAGLYVFGSVYEGFGLPPLEALSFGTPTVAVMASSLVEVLGDAVAYATSGSPAALAEVIVSVMQSPRLRDTLSARGRDRAQQFSWDRSAALHLDVYESAARGVEA